MKNFQLISIIVFVAFAVFGVLVFSGAIPLGGSNAPGSLGTVVMWGTAKNELMAPLLQEFNNTHTSMTVKYVQKSMDTFDQDLLEALANGTGPDMFFLPDNLVYHYSDKIITIPYSSYPLSTFKTNFAGAGEVFLNANGILAFPMTVDPMVMYYNRSMLDANGIASPPVTWDDLVNDVPILTQKDQSNKIIKSAVAMGHFSNVAHAKDILSALFMQVGNDIISEKNGVYDSILGKASSNYNLSDVLNFYINFADPSQSTYSWNKSFPNSNIAFSQEKLAFYFGYASELNSLINSNPNENFLAAPFPQLKNANFKLTNTRVTGLALLSSTKNFKGAFTAASLMATGDFAEKFALAAAVPPARRDLLKAKPDDAYATVFFNSALFARSWLDPSPKNTDDIFENMIDSVLSNSMSPDNAITDADNKLEILLQR